MAETYTIVTQYPDVDTNGGQFARDVITVGVLTAAHGIYFEFRVPKKEFTTSVAQGGANALTITYESFFDYPGVEAVVPGQRLNAANQLEDVVTLYIVSTSGESSDFIVISYRNMTTEYITPRVKG